MQIAEALAVFHCLLSEVFQRVDKALQWAFSIVVGSPQRDMQYPLLTQTACFILKFLYLLSSSA